MMLSDDGRKRFVATCFLFLSPEELKACRLVSKTWNEFIQENLWKSSWGRGELRNKLSARWKTVDPMTVELSRGMQKVFSIFCTDTHVFCGFREHAKVAVYNLSTTELVKEMTPGDVGLGDAFTDADHSWGTVLAGGDGIVTVKWGKVLTVWSTKPDKMEQLGVCWDARNYRCPEATCQAVGYMPHSIRVVNRHKAAFLVCHGQCKQSLVVLQLVDSTWVDKTLACVDRALWEIASDSDWLAVVDIKSKILRLWDGDRSLPEVSLPGCDGLPDVAAMSMDFPHCSVFFPTGNPRGMLIKVIKLRDSVPCLIKTVRFDNSAQLNSSVRLIENKSFIALLVKAHL